MSKYPPFQEIADASGDMGIVVLFGLLVICVGGALVCVGLELAWKALRAYWERSNGR
ncbi:hypothetical protein I5T99_09605 [Stenotrophomonas maltophilia]|nr:hypothetical protein [Stenotrophomonas maltophilia]